MLMFPLPTLLFNFYKPYKNNKKHLADNNKKTLSNNKNKIVYRGNQEGNKITFLGQEITLPKRIRQNTSSTKEDSEAVEDNMARRLVMTEEPKSKAVYDVPFIPEKEFYVDGIASSTNVLDTLAKYTAIHNKRVRLAENSSSLAKPRPVDLSESIGLLHESVWGAQPFYNRKGLSKASEKALANANYFKAFGYIPQEYLVRNWHYGNTNVNTDTPPMLDAIRYYAQGDYNKGDQNHTQNVINYGNKYMNNPTIKQWILKNRNKPKYKCAFIK